MRYVRQLKNTCAVMMRVACFPPLAMAVSSCGSKTAVPVDETLPHEVGSFHADNDIAMTVRSLVDAVRVGEPLDSASYNFSGILTDGQGTPLYTDVEGAPGEWSVRVVSDSEACIRNLYVGDLMADDLRSYIVASLNLNSADLVTVYENPDREGELIYRFDTGDATISFSTVPASSSSGLEGWLMSITVGSQSRSL